MKKHKDKEVEVEEKELKEEVKKKKSTINWMLYLIIGATCLIFVFLTCFNKPEEFINKYLRYIFGALIMVYAAIFLLPFACKKKESLYINVLTWIELLSIGFIGFSLLTHEETKNWDISRCVGLTIYIFGVVEIVRGYLSNGGVKLFKNPILNNFIKYFNIALVTLGSYIFFTQPFSGDNIIIFVRIVLSVLGAGAILLGLIAKPAKS